MENTDKELIKLLDMKFLDPLLFRLLAKKLNDHYDRHADSPSYPEDEILQAVNLLNNAAHRLENFDYEQYADDMKNDLATKNPKRFL